MTPYLRHLVFYLVIALSGMASIGYLFDPLGYFRSRGLRPAWGLGDRVWADNRIAKELSFSGQQPQTIITGSSRVNLGIDVDDPRVRVYLGPAYNLGIGGVSFDMLDSVIRFSMSKPSLRTVVIGLDFNGFARSDKPDPLSSQLFGGARAGLDAAGLPREIGLALWSEAALKAAMKVVIKRPHTQTLTGVGNISKKQIRVRQVGHRVLSQGIEAGYAKFQDSNWQQFDLRMKMFGLLLAHACERGIEMKLFISPAHARQLVLLDTMGKFDRFLQWKSELADITDRYRNAGCAASLTDFSRITSFTSEPFPEPGDTRHAMRWYWESSHYKFELGHLVIQRLWGDTSAPPGFGRILTRENSEVEAAGARAELGQYLRAHPDLPGELKKAAASHDRKRELP